MFVQQFAPNDVNYDNFASRALTQLSDWLLLAQYKHAGQL